MPLPNFIIFGTRKAGTSSLYHYLSQHPEIYMSTLKGSRFFLYDPDKPETGDKLPIKTLDDYAKLFEDAKTKKAKAIGEASPTYMYSEMAARRIKETLPGVRLIASLRNPVNRTYSQYVMNMRLLKPSDRVPLTKDNILKWSDHGLYCKYLKYYYEIFKPEQIKVIMFEEWIAEPLVTLKEIYSFLGVDEDFIADMDTQYNVGGLPKNSFIASIIRSRNSLIRFKPFVPQSIRSAMNYVINKNMKKAPRLSQELEDYLRQYFRDDILALQELLQKDLSIWFKDNK